MLVFSTGKKTSNKKQSGKGNSAETKITWEGRENHQPKERAEVMKHRTRHRGFREHGC